MLIEAVDVVTVALPLRHPWHTAAGTMSERTAVLVHVRGDEGDGWGECAALPDPGYTSEYVAGAADVLRRHLIPALVGRRLGAADVAPALAPVVGHRMAKAALEMAVLDAELRAAGRSFADFLGVTRDRVPAGVALGFAPIDELIEHIGAHVAEGYTRVKLKVAPEIPGTGAGDTDVLDAVRARYADLDLQVDANGAYGPDDVEHLAGFDRYGLQLIEQPFAADDLVTHARLAAAAATPVCLDEPIESLASLEAAVALGACEVVNLKPGRVGGYLEAARIEAWCRGRIPLWCGGMIETGVARAANVALAALDGVTLTGDLSASSRFFDHDLVAEPVVVDQGWIAVPSAPGVGAAPDPEALTRCSIA